MYGRAGFVLLRHRILLGLRHKPSPPKVRQSPSNRVALCDLRVFVDQATEAVAAQNANTCHVGERMDALRSPSRSPPDASHDAFSSSLTTTVFSQRSMRWFGASLRRATPKGQDPSSPAQHRIKDPSYIGPSLRSGHTSAPTGGRDPVSEPTQLALDAYYYPALVLPRQSQDQRGELVWDGRASWRPGLAPLRSSHAAVPAQQRARGHGSGRPAAPSARPGRARQAPPGHPRPSAASESPGAVM
jgi:hypothetical protein